VRVISPQEVKELSQRIFSGDNTLVESGYSTLLSHRSIQESVTWINRIGIITDLLFEHSRQNVGMVMMLIFPQNSGPVTRVGVTLQSIGVNLAHVFQQEVPCTPCRMKVYARLSDG
jgi:hypothetical protein